MISQADVARGGPRPMTAELVEQVEPMAVEVALEAEPAREPAARELRDPFERADLFEQMRRAGHEDELLVRRQHVECAAIHLDHGNVASADDEQRRCAHAAERGAREIRSPTPRYERAHLSGMLSR